MVNFIASFFSKLVDARTASTKDVLIKNLEKALRNEMYRRLAAEVGIKSIISGIQSFDSKWNPEIEKLESYVVVSLENLLEEIK